MTLKRVLFVGVLAAVPALPAAAFLVGSESHARTTTDWIGYAYGRLAEIIDWPAITTSVLPRREDSLPASTKRDSTHAAGSEANERQPWEDPDWDKKVAARILEKLIEAAGEDSTTGALDPVSDSAEGNGTGSPRTPWINPPEAFTTAALPEPPPPMELFGSPPPPASVSLPEQRAGPIAESPVATEEPSISGAIDQPPPATSASADAPADASPATPVGSEDEPNAAQLASIPDDLPDEVAPAEGEPSAAIPLPPPRPELAALPKGKSGRTSSRELVQREENARRFATRYLQSWSANNPEAISAFQQLSGQTIEYFGHSISKRAWLHKKRSFAETWPVRLYRHRPGTVSVRCVGETERCVVKSTVDWETVSPSRGDFAAGVSQLELGIDFSGPQPRIFRESNLRVHARRNLPRPADGFEPLRIQQEFPPQALAE
jgi:hypothetical protein